MTLIPEVRTDDAGHVTNWIEFERWAFCNDVRVHAAIRMAGRGQLSYPEALKFALYLQTVHATELAARITDLHTRGNILPEDIRFPMPPKETPP